MSSSGGISGASAIRIPRSSPKRTRCCCAPIRSRPSSRSMRATGSEWFTLAFAGDGFRRARRGLRREGGAPAAGGGDRRRREITRLNVRAFLPTILNPVQLAVLPAGAAFYYRSATPVATWADALPVASVRRRARFPGAHLLGHLDRVVRVHDPAGHGQRGERHLSGTFAGRSTV